MIYNSCPRFLYTDLYNLSPQTKLVDFLEDTSTFLVSEVQISFYIIMTLLDLALIYAIISYVKVYLLLPFTPGNHLYY